MWLKTYNSIPINKHPKNISSVHIESNPHCANHTFKWWWGPSRNGSTKGWQLTGDFSDIVDVHGQRLPKMIPENSNIFVSIFILYEEKYILLINFIMNSNKLGTSTDRWLSLIYKKRQRRLGRGFLCVNILVRLFSFPLLIKAASVFFYTKIKNFQVAQISF